jgi:polar amino acid transport system substrate-binding protein
VVTQLWQVIKTTAQVLRSAGVFGMVLGMQWAVSPAVVAAELADIQDRGYLIVAVKDNWLPLGFRDDSGELLGFEIDIARRLAAELLGDPNAVRFEPVSNVSRVNVVVEGAVDIAIATVTVTSQRQRIASFSTPYYLDGTGFITRNPQNQTLEALASSHIALLNHSSSMTHVRYILPAAELIGVETYQAALELLETGQIDAFAGDVTVLAGWQQQDDQYYLLPTIISAEPLAIVIPKGTQYSSLRRVINAAIERWHVEGWLTERAAFWGLP